MNIYLKFLIIFYMYIYTHDQNNKYQQIQFYSCLEEKNITFHFYYHLKDKIKNKILELKS